jgi:hypothetical protein
MAVGTEVDVDRGYDGRVRSCCCALLAVQLQFRIDNVKIVFAASQSWSAWMMPDAELQIFSVVVHAVQGPP